MAVLGDTGSLLENLTAVRTFSGQNFINSALTDIGITLFAQTGIHKQLVDITKSCRLAVNIVFTVAAAIIPTGNHHLISIIGQGAVAIIQCQGCFRKTNCHTLLGTAENHVLHFGATESLGALFAHNPQNGVGNIGFAGTVGADNGGDIVTEPNQGLIRKGFETLHFQRF